MSDLIERQAAIDAVCMEWCNVKHQDCKHPFDDEKDDYYWCDGCETVLRTLPDLPPAQPEIIRCKECKFYTEMRTDLMTGICSLACRHLGNDGFCSEAERRE